MYKIIGADGKEYGPISADQLRQWIAEGRVNASTQILPEGATEWRPVSAFPEFMASVPVGAPPPTFSLGQLPATSSAADQVSGPAIGLMIVAVLYLLGVVSSLMFRLLGASILAASRSQNEAFVHLISGTAGLISMVFVGALGCIILVGAIKMKRLENYALAMTASILAMLPCTVCCVVGLPIGIWSLVVLSKPEVKSAFH